MARSSPPNDDTSGPAVRHFAIRAFADGADLAVDLLELD
jgi:hypothetical protein